MGTDFRGTLIGQFVRNRTLPCGSNTLCDARYDYRDGGRWQRTRVFNVVVVVANVIFFALITCGLMSLWHRCRLAIRTRNRM
ncbi:MAG TPA: hypothetical protein VK335_10930 [Bryobacteraceae bacterium]|nr:hypothetical protein [Bryobacteraceae bacterium]